MLEGFKQFIVNAKAKLMLKKAASILSKLEYEVVDTDPQNFSLAFKFDEDSVALFIVDAGPFGSRIESTILLTSDIANLKLVSDLAQIASAYRCSISGLSFCGGQKSKIEVNYHLGRSFSKHDVGFGLAFMIQCLNTMSERLVEKIDQTTTFKFDMSAFDDERIPFFDPQLIGERLEFMYGKSWDDYLKMAANQQAVSAYTAVDVDHDLRVVMACREFERDNGCSLAEVGSVVMLELAKHRTNLNKPEDKKQIN